MEVNLEEEESPIPLAVVQDPGTFKVLLLPSLGDAIVLHFKGPPPRALAFAGPAAGKLLEEVATLLRLFSVEAELIEETATAPHARKKPTLH